jgi:Na+/phosphate symporter
LFVEDVKQMRRHYKSVSELYKKAKKLKKDIHKTVAQIQDDMPEAGHYYVMIIDYLREMAHAQEFAAKQMLDHLENNHKSMTFEQVEELRALKELLTSLIQMMKEIIDQGKYENMDLVKNINEEIINHISKISKSQIKRVNGGKGSTKATLLYFSIIHEVKNFNSHSNSLLKAHRDFISTKGN